MPIYKTFDKQELIDTLNDDCDYLDTVSDTYIESTRWASLNLLVLKDSRDNKFYSTTYRQGLTEQQDESPFENEDDTISCKEVKPVEVTVTKYVAV